MTVPEYPSTEESCIEAVADPPADVIVNPGELAATENASPPPLSATVCGELLALSVTVSVPVRVPAAVGVKVTEIMQLAPAAILGPQADVSAKSPEAATAVMLRAAVPEFVRVTVWAALAVPTVSPANVRLAGELVTAGSDISV